MSIPSTKTSRMLRFTSVHLENWRNFRHVEVELQRRVFLVGPNASGKSNFLDVFRFLQDIASVGGGLQEAVRKRGGLSSIRSLAARQNPDVVVQAQLGDESNGAAWTYELRLGQDKVRRPQIKKERVIKGTEEVLARPRPEDETDPERRTQTYLEQVNVNREFRAIADFFASIRYLHIVPQLVREPERSVGRVNDPYGGDFLEQIARTPVQTQKARLRRIRDALRVAVPQLQELELWRDERGTPHLRGKYEHWRPQGAWQTEERFSDGTLRLMGLLWAALERAGPLLLEEPELSLHPDVVRYIPPMFARVQRSSARQIMVSTHSPDLLQDRGIGLDEVLLLLPKGEGTEVRLANSFGDVPSLLKGGLSLSEIVLPRTRPARADQLALFGADA
jgi:predicted ATPase